MTRNVSPLFSSFFKGDSLENEFGFIDYYHNHPINRILHILALPLLIFSFLTITYSIDYRLAVLFYLFYCTIILFINVKCGFAFIILFGVLLGPAILFASQKASAMFYALLICFTALAMQGIGHYIFQKYAPAFRLFEAIFTTPTYLMMYMITNNNNIFWYDVKNETDKWKQILKK